MDKGARWATVHGMAKSRTPLKWLSTHACTYTHTHTHTHTVQATLPSLSLSPIPPTLTQTVLHTLPLCSHTTQTECSTKVIFTPHGNCQSQLKGPSATQGQGPPSFLFISQCPTLEGNGNPLSILTWLGGQQSMGSQRVAHDWATHTFTVTKH